MSILRYSQIILPESGWVHPGFVGQWYRIVPYESDDTPDHTQRFWVYWRGELESLGSGEVILQMSFGELPWENTHRLEINHIDEEGPVELTRSDLEEVSAIAPIIRIALDVRGDPEPRIRGFARLCSDAPFRLVPVSL